MIVDPSIERRRLRAPIEAFISALLIIWGKSDQIGRRREGVLASLTDVERASETKRDAFIYHVLLTLSVARGDLLGS